MLVSVEELQLFIFPLNLDSSTGEDNESIISGVPSIAKFKTPRKMNEIKPPINHSGCQEHTARIRQNCCTPRGQRNEWEGRV